MTIKSIFQTGIAAVLLAGAAIVPTSCDDESWSSNLSEKVLVKEINLLVSPELPLLRGRDSLIRYTVGPEEANDKSIVWSSSDPSVASVDDKGRISALKVGEAVITASPAVGYTTTASVTVKVIDHIDCIKDIKLTNELLEVYATATLPLTWETDPAEPTYPTLTWESLTPDIATVNEKGEVKGVAPGTARIKATATDDEHFSKVFEVTVKPIIPIESLSFVQSSDVLALDGTYVPAMNVYPADATLSMLQWSSSNPDVVEIDEQGRFIVKGYGSAEITARADYDDGHSVEATMSVTVPEGLMNDNFEFEQAWEPFSGFAHKEFDWLQDEQQLRIFPGDDKQYKAVRISRIGGFAFNVSKYPILAFKVKFPKGVYEASTNMEWYLDIWGGDGITVAGKYDEGVNKGNRSMAVVDCGDYKVFYADLTKKPLGKNNQLMPTTLTKYNTVELQLWKIWYEASETGYIYVDWVRTFASQADLDATIKAESK